jgi:hypothetical protein
MKRAISILFAGGVAMAAMTSVSDAAPRVPVPVTLSTEYPATPVYFRRGLYVAGGVYYFNGYRGNFGPRPGYVYYNGYWFPGAAFAAGVATERAVRVLPPVPVITTAHVRWCYERYVSYRTWDDTFQPYVGPRQHCWSPYD